MRGLRIHRHGSVGEVLLARNAVNSLDPQLVNDLASSLAELATESGVHALVLGSAEEKFFSGGWDLPHLLELDRAGVTAFVAAPLRRLSLTHQKARPLAEERSSRMRPTNTSSRWSLLIGMG